MFRRIGTVAVFLLVAVCIAATSGCAGTGTKGSDTMNDPELIRREIVDIENEILNAEEMYKAGLTELQMEEDADSRREVNRLWIELEHLRSRKAALEQRLVEIKAEVRATK